MLNMKKQFERMHDALHQLNQKQQAILQLLEGGKSSSETEILASLPKSTSINQERERKKKELKKKLPKHLNTQETIDTLETVSSNFYRNLYKIILFPVFPNNSKQPRYRRSHVIKLKFSAPHQPGAHTYSKLKRKPNARNVRKKDNYR